MFDIFSSKFYSLTYLVIQNRHYNIHLSRENTKQIFAKSCTETL